MDGLAEAYSALCWWRDAGVDTLVDDMPRDWLRPAAQLAVPVAPPLAPASQPVVPGTAAPVALTVPAPSNDALPDSLHAYAAWCADPAVFPDLGPRRVCAAGDPASGLMMLCDMPEPGDADAGMLLGGDLGRLFDRILAAIGRDRASVYLAAICPARPPGGRIGAATSAGLIRAAQHHVALAAPRCLLLMGKEATAAFGLPWPAARGRLHVVNHSGGNTAAIATLHPRMLLQSPARKADMWADLQLLTQELNR